MKIALIPCVTLLLAAGAGAAAAQPAGSNAESDKAQAQALLREGNGLLTQGRAADALSKFSEAYRLVPSPKLHYNLGQAASALPGHEAQAFEELSLFLDEAKDASAELRSAAEAKRQQLRAKVGLVTVVAIPADADLTVDGKQVGQQVGKQVGQQVGQQVGAAGGKGGRGRPLVLGVGAHRLSLDRGPVTYGAETVTIAGGETIETRLGGGSPPPAASAAVTAPALAATPAAGPPATGASLTSAPAPAPDRGGWSWQRKLGVGLGVAAVASLAFAIVETVDREGTATDFRNAGCGTRDLTQGDSCQGLYDQIKDAERLLTIGYIGAAVFGGAAAFFWLSPAPPAPAGATTASGGGGSGSGSGLTVNLGGRF